MVSSLACLALLLNQNQTQKVPHVFTFGDRSVLLAPREVPTDLPKEVIDWKGWAYADQNRTFPKIAKFPSKVNIGAEEFDAAAKPTLTLPVKVYLFRRSNTLGQTSGPGLGSPIEYRSSLADFELEDVYASLARVAASISVRSQGKIGVNFIVEPITWPINFDLTREEQPDIFQKLLENDENLGTFDADDRVYRGPFLTTIFLYPSVDEAGHPVNIFGRPSTVIGYRGTRPIEPIISSSIVETLRALFPDAPKNYGAQPTLDESIAAARLDTLSTDVYNRAQSQSFASPFQALAPEENVELSVSPNYRARITRASGRSDILELVETGFLRDGAVALPKLTAEQSEHGKYLTFDFQSESIDTTSLDFRSGEWNVSYVLGRLPYTSKAAAAIELALNPSPKWQHVVIDLDQVRPHTHGHIETVTAGPCWAQIATERLTLEPRVYHFENFRIKDSLDQGEVVTPAAAEDATSTTAKVAKLTEAVSKPTPAMRALAFAGLSDPSIQVRLSAIAYLAKNSDKDSLDILDPLSKQALGVDARVTEAAIKALAPYYKTGAGAIIRRAVDLSPTELGKVTAARIVALNEDPAITSGILATFIADRSWESRATAVDILATLSGTEAIKVMLTFSQDLSPVVRAEVVAKMPTSADDAASRMEYLAVNDPSDAVRIGAERWLMLSPNAADTAAKNGLKIAKDESWYVRAQAVTLTKLSNYADILATLAADPEGAVRARAAEAIDLNSPAAKPLLTDPDARVHRALLQRADSLPVEGRATLKSSPDLTVAQKAKSLWPG